MATSRKSSNPFAREVKTVCKDLVRSFDKERWDDLVETLERVSEVGEKNGQRQISIQAQSLRMSIENRARITESTPFGEMTDQFDMLVTSLKEQLTYLAWTKEIA